MDLRARGTSVTLTPRVNLRPNSSHHHKPGTLCCGQPLRRSPSLASILLSRYLQRVAGANR
jgi:hypothetical protein